MLAGLKELRKKIVKCDLLIFPGNFIAYKLIAWIKLNDALTPRQVMNCFNVEAF